MDLPKLADLQLPDSTGVPRRLADFWAERPVILVFLRHFGWLLCREHASQLRGTYDEIQRRGADVVAIGTGSVRHAAVFVADEDVPFPVLVDDDARAAQAASVRRVGFIRLFTDRRSRPGAKRARAAGHRIHKAGKRVTQLGATFVLGPGDQVHYEHLDDHSADHAPLDDVLAALPPVATR